jgi:hypothetical protein
VSVVGDETQRVDVDWVNRLRLLARKRLIPVEESAFRNGIQRGLSGPFGGLDDPFGECRFSWVNVSLGYDVLPGPEVHCKPFRFNGSSPVLPGTPIDGEMSTTDFRALDPCRFEASSKRLPSAR